MVMKTLLKTTIRLFKKHIMRFLTLIAISIVSVGFMFGVMEIQNKLDSAIIHNYQQYNASDLYIKSKRFNFDFNNPELGFSSEEITFFEDTYGSDHIEKSFCIENLIDDEVIRLYYFDLDENHINKLELLEGRMPSSPNEVLVERKTEYIKGYNLNDEIVISNGFHEDTFKVTGIVFNPLINNKKDEICFSYEDKFLNNVVYLRRDAPFINLSEVFQMFPDLNFEIDEDMTFNIELMGAFLNTEIVNDIHITLENRDLFKGFSSKYEKEIDAQKEYILSNLDKDALEVLSLYENFGFYSIHSYGNKINIIGSIFLVFFFIVTLLIVHSTMTRLLDEERSQIACLKTLGYNNFRIIFKYILFVSLSTLIGGAISLFVGYGFCFTIYNAFNLQYVMPSITFSISYLRFFGILSVMLLALIILIIWSSLRIVKHKPIELLTPKAPKMGRKVILEKITPLWKRLSFKYKSTCRNILLFRNRFIMTILSIVGCSVLVFAGFGLLDCSNNIPNGSTLITISIALIAFAAALCALVIYNLTNINVSERTREIATLMVLGYKDKEILGYIFREIYLMSIIGIIIGIPTGVLFIDFVFYLIDFGSLGDINWWTYIISPLVAMVFCIIASLLLCRKIIKTDMNASLKILE